jgi:hypothetical protein
MMTNFINSSNDELFLTVGAFFYCVVELYVFFGFWLLVYLQAYLIAAAERTTDAQTHPHTIGPTSLTMSL